MERCTELESELAELRAAYEQYFLGHERLPPLKKHDGLKKQFMKLKGSFVRQTAAKFRIESIGQKILTYERLWGRTLKEIEDGTYKRDLAKLKRRTQAAAPPKKQKESAEPDFAVDEDLDLSDLNENDEFDLSSVVAAAEAAFTPSVVSSLGASRPVNGAPLPPRAPPKPQAPVAAAPPPPPPKPAPAPAEKPAPVFSPPKNPLTRAAPGAHAEGGLSDTKIKAIYEAFVMAKKRCGEDVRTVTLDAVSTSIKKQVPELMKQHNAKSVEFRVIIKDGKAVLRALPKT